MSALRALASNLRRNVLAGARLALFRRVSPLDFRIAPADFAVLFVFVLAIGFVAAFVRDGLPGEVNLGALPAQLSQVPLVLAACIAIAALLRQDALVLGLALALFASDPLFAVAGLAVWFAMLLLPAALAVALGYAFVAWGLAAAVRALLVFSGWHGARSLAAAGILTALFGAFVFVLPRAELWVPVEIAAEDAEPPPSIADERNFHAQPRLLEEALARLAPERRGVEDLYFVGVAPYSAEDVFVREARYAQALFDARFGTAGRSILLANSPDTLADLPIATATNLRAVLGRLARIMNTEEDVLFLFITTHGDERHSLAFDLPPLNLAQLTPSALGRMLQDAGIKWKVLVVSACYSGGFIEPLRDADTVVITAADARSPSFGCANGNEFTDFGRAFVKEGLTQTFSFAEAFEAARRTVTERERAERLDPSSPQIHVGTAIRGKLESLERRLSEALSAAAGPVGGAR